MSLGWNDHRVLGIMPSSRLSALSLSSRTCPLGLLVVVGLEVQRDSAWVYNEEVSGDVVVKHDALWRNADVVLLSSHAGNIARSLFLARLAHVEGKRVVLGGPEPSMIGPSLLRCHPFIDALVVGPGEGVLKWFLRRGHAPEPPGIWLQGQMQNDDPIGYRLAFRSLDFPNIHVDYSRLFDLEMHEGLSYLWGNDCAQARKRCFFCGRMTMGVGYRPAERVWNELTWAYRRGVRRFYNTTDSVTTNGSEFRRFCEAKPTEMQEDVHRVFVNASGVDGELVRALQHLNGVAVIGVESFGRLKATGKARTGIEDNLRAIRILAENQVRMVLSFVLGLPGETTETLRETEQGIIDLVQDHGHLVDSIHLSPLLVTTGSPAWRRLMALPEVRSKYASREVPFDVIEVTNDYFRFFCDVSREFCIERIFRLCETIRAIAPWIRIGAKGILKSEEAAIQDENSRRETEGVRHCAEQHSRQISVRGHVAAEQAVS